LLWQLYPSYLLITLVSVAAVSLYATEAMRGFYLNESAEGLEERARLLVPLISDALYPLNPAALDRICKEVAETADTRVTVILPDGQVAGDSREDPAAMDNHLNRPEVGRALRSSAGAAIRYSSTLEKDMMYVAIPVSAGGRIGAVLRTAVNVAAIDAKLDALRIKLLIWGGVIALLAAGVSFWISRRMARPLEEMRRGVDHFAGGDLAYRLSTPPIEEMAAVSRAMNEMAAHLDDRIRTVINQRNELEAVLSSMQEGVLAVDMDEQILSINLAGARMLDRSPAQLEGRSIQEAIRNPAFHRFTQEALSGSQPRQTDILFYHAGERTLHLHSSTLRNGHGERIGTLIVFSDVTRLRRLENMRRDFAANVSHEIKTPLTAIQGFVETLDGGALEDPKSARRFLSIIQRHVERLSAIIEDLMNLSRIEGDGEEAAIQRERQPIRPPLEAAIAICTPLAAEKSIDIELECDPALQARISRSLLEQAAVNLLNNAIQYSNSGSAVRIEAVPVKSELVIAFRDQGIGIPRAQIPRLFERFYRVDKARSRTQGGTGLGLAIVKHIVAAHNGHITVESVPGKGSTFALHLPLDRAHDS
jgi:two-component system phosphate regulon sensor histidine kinase PhoR